MSDDVADHIDTILAEWRRERPELDWAPMAILGRLFRATTLADAALAPPLAALGLQPGWTDLLAALRRAGRPHELNPTDLMRATMLTSGGITKRLDRLAEAGLVQRRPDPSDRRGTLVGLTRKGKALIDRAVPAHLANQERILQPLTSTERRTLERLLRTLLAGLERSASGTNGVRSEAGLPHRRPL